VIITHKRVHISRRNYRTDPVVAIFHWPLETTVIHHSGVLRHLLDLAHREIMTLKVDEKADALYLRLDDSKIIESEEVSPGVILDFNADNQVVGVEILYLSKRSPKLNLHELQFQVLIRRIKIEIWEDGSQRLLMTGSWESKS
jgi:uncharacterized protein YuzE